MAKQLISILKNVTGQLAQSFMFLNMKLCRGNNQALILTLLLLASGVQARRVIRAAPGVKTTGCYMIVLTPETSHERFEAIAKEVKSESSISDIHTIEGPFAKMIVTKISVDEAKKVSLNCNNTHTHTYSFICTHYSLTVKTLR